MNLWVIIPCLCLLAVAIVAMVKNWKGIMDSTAGIVLMLLICVILVFLAFGEIVGDILDLLNP